MILDNTQIETFNICPRKFYWRHIRNLVKDIGESPALTFGQAIHSSLEALYRGDTLDKAIEIFKAQHVEHPEEEKRTVENGIRIIEEYYKRYFPEAWKVLHVESSISIELAKDLLFYGRLDLIVEFMGTIYVVDHKTSSIMRFIGNPNHQLSGYIACGRSLGLDVTGAIINLIGVYKSKVDFKRLITTRRPEELEEWRHHVLYTKCRIDECLENRWFPKYTHSCYRYGVNCPYIDLCTVSEKHIQSIMEGSFKVEPWEPWNVGVD